MMKGSRFLVMATLAISVSACNKIDINRLPEPLSQWLGERITSGTLAVSASSEVAAMPVAPVGVRETFATACVNSALQGREETAGNPESQVLAKQICDCVYNEGEKAYADKMQWETAVAMFEQPEKADAKLAQTVDTALNSCVRKWVSPEAASDLPSAFASNTASASQVANNFSGSLKSEK